jgi:hypothetical protein
LRPIPSQRVVVILDPDYGERLREVRPGVAVWIVMSPANEPVVRALRAITDSPEHLTGITGMKIDHDATPEEVLLDELNTIDLHHGPYSSSKPYTALEAIGATLTIDLREALRALGFIEFTENAIGFVARRSEEEAWRPRE